MDTNLEQRITKLEKLLFETDKYYNGSGETSEAPYLVYTALLNQSGTDAPVATVLQNTIGTITWSYENSGVYYANCSNCFIENKTVIAISPIPFEGLNNTSLTTSRLTSSIITIIASADSAIDNTTSAIEIRVYP